MMHFLLVLSLMVVSVNCFQCEKKYYGEDRIVCVCNATNCGSFGIKIPDSVEEIPLGQVQSYTTSKAGLRFEKGTGQFVQQIPTPKTPLSIIFNFLKIENQAVTINRSEQFQTMLGVGGSFTDATGINLDSLSESTRENILKSYYSVNGLQYSVGRVPIGGSDFSLYPYTYDDDHPDDVNLTYFSLKQEDYDYKINNIQKAEKLLGERLNLIASPWSAPAWMKSNGEIHSGGFLKKEYYQTWANYFVKFLDAYSENNISFFGVTTENEPVMGLIPFYLFNCMGYTPSRELDFIKYNLGPTLESSSHNAVKILNFDDQRTFIDYWSSQVLTDPEANKYISGVAFHWYFNSFSSVSLQSKVHDKFPDKFLISTEACAGFLELDPSQKVIMGSWDRGVAYAKDIMENFQNWAVGWIDWNMALNASGGPNWAGLAADSAIIVNATADEFYQQPMFFALGHFSKFVRPGAKRIYLGTENLPASVNAIAFQGPGKITSIIIHNTGSFPHNVSFHDLSYGYFQQYVPADSIVSLVWKSDIAS